MNKTIKLMESDKKVVNYYTKDLDYDLSWALRDCSKWLRFEVDNAMPSVEVIELTAFVERELIWTGK